MTVRSFFARVRRIAALGVFVSGALMFAGSAQAQAPAGGPSPVTWFRADSIKGVAAGANVAVWPDSSGGKNDATQPVAAQQPLFVPNAVNGHPAVHFTSEDSTQLVLKRPVQDAFTIVCVFQSKQGLGNGDGWYSGAGLVDGEVEGVHNDFGLALSASGQLICGAGSTNPYGDTYLVSDDGFNDGRPHVVTFTRNKETGALTLYTDGVQADTAVSGTLSLTDPPRLTLGSSQLNKGYLTGDIAEVQIYDKALSVPERQAVETALTTKYGIVASASTESPPAAVPLSARLNPVILPPDPRPAIHGPKIVGASPQHPFLFLIPATGADPLTYACADLPAGLTLDAASGVITGAVRLGGNYTLHLSVSNSQGTAQRALTLVCGDHPLALTPPMGWDAVNIYANQIDDEKTRNAADDLVKTGLAAHGYSYVHINDTWQSIRDKTGTILPNRKRFPNPKDLGDYLHGKGLKFGLASSATEHTCAGYPGSAGFVTQDAETYAAWGVDYLEYDWCPLPTLDVGKPPGDKKAAYREMRDALNKTDRDVVLAANTFGNDSIWDWGASVGVNSWVTSQIVYDDWDKVVKAFWGNQWISQKAQPGHWNDPGLLQIGKFGFGQVHKTNLNYPEQMAQFSQCALLSAPLWLSCDLTSLDPNAFHPSTTALLTNDEVIDVDQDPLGHGATQVVADTRQQVWSKPLSDGTLAVGLFNFSDVVRRVRIRLSTLSRTGAQPVRDLWLHQDLGNFTGAFATDVPPHGVALVKIGAPKPSTP